MASSMYTRARNVISLEEDHGSQGIMDGWMDGCNAKYKILLFYFSTADCPAFLNFFLVALLHVSRGVSFAFYYGLYYYLYYCFGTSTNILVSFFVLLSSDCKADTFCFRIIL